MFRATTASTFSTSEPPKMVRTPRVFNILTWGCVSRHNGVQCFISRLASWLRTRRFSEPTFRPSGTTNHSKNTMFRDFPTFSRICIFFLLTFFFYLFFNVSLFYSFSSTFFSSNFSLLSASSLLCFSSVHIVGSLTPKLPSAIHTAATYTLHYIRAMPSTISSQISSLRTYLCPKSNIPN